MFNTPELDVPTKKEKITFICDTDTRSKLESWAEEEGRSLSNLVERIVSKALADKEGDNKS